MKEDSAGVKVLAWQNSICFQSDTTEFNAFRPILTVMHISKEFSAFFLMLDLFPVGLKNKTGTVARRVTSDAILIRNFWQSY